MEQVRSAPPAVLVRSHPAPAPEACVGRMAGLLAGTGDAALPAALAALVDGLGLRGAVLRGPRRGAPLAVAGEVLSAACADLPVVDVPVRGLGGRDLGSLVVTGARPTQLPALRSAAAVLALALAPLRRDPLLDPLLDAAEADRDALADALHDGPVQDLVAARWLLDAGDHTAAAPALRAATAALRRTLWHLRPRGAAGLVPALTALDAQLRQGGGPGLVVHGDADLHGAPAALAYRLVQAAAGAGELVVELSGSGLVLQGATALDTEVWARRLQAAGGDLVRLGPTTVRASLPAHLPTTHPPDEDATP